MNLEFNTQSAKSDHWIKIENSTAQSSRSHLQEHVSRAKCEAGERIYIRSNFRASQGKIKQWVASIPANETVTINHSNPEPEQKIKLIYFCNCNLSSLYPKIVRHHLKDLQKSGIDKRKNFFAIFVICGTHKDVKIIKRIAKKFIPGVFDGQAGAMNSREDRFEIRLHENTHYEHQGIRALWSESYVSNENDILFYAHCKSLSKIDQLKQVSHLSKACSEIILRNTDTIVSLLNTFESVDRVGISQANGMYFGEWGWMWHNFYAAKARYLKSRPKPLLPDCRFYYESWLGGRKIFEKNHLAPDKNTGISMLSEHGISIGQLTESAEITEILNNYSLHESKS